MTSLSSYDHDLEQKEVDTNGNSTRFQDHYLKKAISILSCNILDGTRHDDSFDPEMQEEPFLSNKFKALINILSEYRIVENTKCIVFVKRVCVARAMACVLQNLKSLESWKCELLVGCHSGPNHMSRHKMDTIVKKFSSGEVNLLIATSVAEEGLDIQTCCLVVRFDLPETVASFIQSRGRARMTKSKYVIFLERENDSQKAMLHGYIDGETIMDREIDLRTSNDTFEYLEENPYQVNETGASISTASSVSLLHDTHDIDNIEGIICTVALPPNAALRQVDGQSCQSKDGAKRNACLKTCMELHELGPLTDFVLPRSGSRKNKVSTANGSTSSKHEDGSLGKELHEMLIPTVLKPSGCQLDYPLNLHFYYFQFIAIPEDTRYRMFGLFVINPLPAETEKLKVDLHLACGRIVNAKMEHIGTMSFDEEQMVLARNFQEMFLKILLDRSEFIVPHVMLGKDETLQINSKFYLLLPIKQESYGEYMIDWLPVERCLSSPVFKGPIGGSVNGFNLTYGSLRLLDNVYSKIDVVGSLIFAPHTKTFFIIDAILKERDATSDYNGATYEAHYKERFGINLSHPRQPLLHAKQLFNVHNLLRGRLQETREGCEMMEQFMELPPELCTMRITGFSKDICSSLSLLPSFMHRLENLLVAIELKETMLSSFSEASQISASGMLEALTTERCLESISLERFEILGDAFLKYIVGLHNFISYQELDEGELTSRRSAVVSNSNLYELAIRRNLQVYIRDQQFEPMQFIALGRPCKVVCDAYTEVCIPQKNINSGRQENCNFRCTKSHHWLHRKTIADVVESLVGAFIVEGGFKAAYAFLRWIGIKVDFEDSSFYQVLDASSVNLSLMNHTDVAELEELIDYKFKYKGLILEACVHPSFNKHSGGCYERLEYLGDAVLEYLITSYLYSSYPDLTPGEITDLKSSAVNNHSLAYVAVQKCIHKYLIKDSNHLSAAVDKFVKYSELPNSEKDLVEEPACPKVLGDIVESCVAAVLLDSGINLSCVWKLVLMLLKPVLSFSNMHMNPMREIRELCQSHDLKLGLPEPIKADGEYNAKVNFYMEDSVVSCAAINQNSKVATKLAAQKAPRALKVLCTHKTKSLGEILHDAKKGEPVLLGYDEEPIKVEADICEEIIQLCSKESDANNSSKNTGVTIGGASKTSSLRTTGDTVYYQDDAHNKRNNQQMVAVHNGCLSKGTQKISEKKFDGDTVHETASSYLFELCAASYWKPPEFELCGEKGPSHLGRFTCKLTVQIGGHPETILECYSDPKLQKEAACEHAAEGALWYLKQGGYLPFMAQPEPGSKQQKRGLKRKLSLTQHDDLDTAPVSKGEASGN